MLAQHARPRMKARLDPCDPDAPARRHRRVRRARRASSGGTTYPLSALGREVIGEHRMLVARPKQDIELTQSHRRSRREDLVKRSLSRPRPAERERSKAISSHIQLAAQCGLAWLAFELLWGIRVGLRRASAGSMPPWVDRLALGAARRTAARSRSQNRARRSSQVQCGATCLWESYHHPNGAGRYVLVLSGRTA
jgi:hypothetical protein